MKNFILISYTILGICVYSALFSQEIEKLPKSINSRFLQYAPTLSADGKSLILASNRNKDIQGFRLYESQNQNGEWTERKSIDRINFFKRDTFSVNEPCLSYDGKYLFYTISQKGISKIYYSIKEKSLWSSPLPVIMLGESLSEKIQEKSPSLSADGKKLYFAREEKNTKGKITSKIYVSEKNENNNWDEAQALPEIINSSFESNPRILADNCTLIFAALKPEGKGGFDLYQSAMNPKGNWSKPVPLDLINTEADERFAVFDAKDKLLYFNRVSKKSADIFQLSLPDNYLALKKFIKLKIIVKDSISQNPVNAELKLFLEEPNADYEFGKTIVEFDKTDNFSLDLQKGYIYRLIVEAKNYLTKTLSLNYEKINDDSLSLPVLLTPARLENPVSFLIKDKITGENIDAHIKIINLTKNEVVILNGLAQGGYYSLDLAWNNDYGVEVTAMGYTYFQGIFSTRNLAVAQELKQGLFLESTKNNYLILEITDKQSGGKLDAELFYSQFKSLELAKKAKASISEGYFALPVEPESTYLLHVFAKGYVFKSLSIDIKELKKGENLEQKIDLETLQAGAKIIFQKNELAFKGFNLLLNEYSKEYLEQIVLFLVQNPALNLEISAHENLSKDGAKSLALSQKKTDSIKNYLISRGIAAERLIATGYGFKVPFGESATPKERIEFIVIN